MGPHRSWINESVDSNDQDCTKRGRGLLGSCGTWLVPFLKPPSLISAIILLDVASPDPMFVALGSWRGSLSTFVRASSSTVADSMGILNDAPLQKNASKLDRYLSYSGIVNKTQWFIINRIKPIMRRFTLAIK
ncbi:hypothetical protein POX_h09755 [Penicillium oxalicum]|uniref:hypothetical protein n=1 Tax=Penicillium oxalicum TaxID=69781 RepID=UPI0020B75BC0|nr:hypothetical protein POX_h09755 [Penicillium oxalicum]KAI2785990.1 hypothetical protein POX_h09755 [Penicillium oxalicum]